ncbi:TolB family protein [Desertivirga brevis]|uniref:TolB family protein n=1 Tax=Desertivirga brevis TaxID=2810310 RepID=UPI001A97C9CD|nr:PD40 domain-containing protein [Pedobacter sp. SYSU D00873]
MRYLSALLLLLTVISCTKDSNNNVEPLNSSFFWVPDLIADRGDQKVDLVLRDPRPYTSYSSEPATPDHFEVYFGTDSSSLKLFKNVKVGTDRITLSKLNNNVPYYFFVKTFKGTKFYNSDTVSAVPSAPLEITEVFPGEMLQDPSKFSFNNTFVASQINPGIKVRNRTTNSEVKNESNASAPNWAHLVNKLAFYKTIKEGNTVFTDKIMVYDADANTEVLVWDVDHKEYAVSGMAFSADDKALLINTLEKRADKAFMNMWKIDLTTKVKTSIADFGALNFHPTGRISAGIDGKSVLIDGDYNLPPTWRKRGGIYRYNFETKQLQQLINGRGHGGSFAESPDGAHIAFVSNWTGKDEVWLYNTTTKGLKQLTNSSGQPFYYTNADFKWGGTDLLINLYSNNSHSLYKIKL